MYTILNSRGLPAPQQRPRHWSDTRRCKNGKARAQYYARARASKDPPDSELQNWLQQWESFDDCGVTVEWLGEGRG